MNKSIILILCFIFSLSFFSYGKTPSLRWPKKQNGKIGYINQAGEIVIQPKYKISYEFTDGYALISLNEGWGFIYKNYRLKIEPGYDRVSDLTNKCLSAILRQTQNVTGRFTDN